MILVILTALAAVCGAAKLDQNYLPPASARTAGGSPGTLLAPLEGSNQGLPTGSYTNDAQGVVVDAVNPGTRTSGHEPTGLGGPRPSYGSKDSKVGDAAFRISSFGGPGINTRIAPGFGSFVEADGAQGDKTSGNTLKFTSDVGSENYSYGFETDNGLSAAGHVDDGSYNAQKYNNGGDNSSNGVSNNNRRPTLGGVDATSSSSYVSQSSQVHRPTSGVLVGSYNPGSDAIHSSQGQGFSQSGIKQSNFNYGSSSQGGQTSFSSHLTENRFGAQATKSGGTHAYAQASAANAPVRSQNFPNLPGSSAYSSATGSGSSSAFASAGSFNSGLKNEYNSLSNSFGSFGQRTEGSKYGSDSSAGASIFAPSTATASASVSGSQTQLSGFQQQSQSLNLPSSVSATASTSENQNSFSHTNQQESNAQSASVLNNQSSNQSSHYINTISIPLPPKIQAIPISPIHTGSNDASATASASQNQNSFSHSYQQESNAQLAPVLNNQSPNEGSYSIKPVVIPLPPKIQAIPISTIHTGSNDASATASTSQNQNSFSHSNQQESNAQPAPVFNNQSPNQGSYSIKPIVIPLPPKIQAIPISPIHTGSNDASATASASQNQNGFSHSNQQVSVINTESNSNTFPNRFGESQKDGSSATNVENLPSVNILESTGKPSSNSKPHGFDSSSATQFSGVQSTQGNLGFVGSQGPNKVPDTDLTTPFESNAKPASVVDNQSSNQGSYSINTVVIPLPSPIPPISVSPIDNGSADATYVSSTQKPFISQQQGNDHSYYYTHPSKPFITPPVISNGQYSNNRQPNIPISSISPQSSSFQNGITQAAISPFTSDSSSSSTQFASQSSQFGSKPLSQFGQSNKQTNSQIGSTETHLGQIPIVQSQTQFGQSPTSQNSDSSQSGSQQYQGTVYEYNKPVTTLPAQGPKETSSSFGQATLSQTNLQGKPGQVQTDTRFGTQQSSSQLGSQSSFQQTQIGSNAQTPLFNQKPVVTSQVTGSNYQQGQFGSGSYFGLKPQTTQSSGFTYSQSQTSQFDKKPASLIQTGSTSQQTQVGTSGSLISKPTGGLDSTTNKPSYTQKPFGSSYQQTQGYNSQFGSKPQTQGPSVIYTQSPTSPFEKKPATQTGSQFGQNIQTTHGSGLTSTSSQTSFGIKPTYQQSQYQYSQGYTSQFGKKPVSTIQTGITSQQNQFGSQFSQNSQPGADSVSTTPKPSYNQKPFGSSYSQSQFGSVGSQFGSKPQNTQGSSFTYSQTGSQTSQYENKPVSTIQTGITSQQNQFGSQFSQNSQPGAGSVLTTPKPSYNQKPFGSSYSQSQFGSVGSQFGSKPQNTQGSSFTYSQTGSQTSQYENKPVSTIQTGITSQQNRFGSSGFQFNQNSQPTVGSGSASTTLKPSYNQKPFGSSYSQSQFGSVGSQFGSKPQNTQGNTFTYSQTGSQTSQYEKKPVSTIQTGITSQQTQSSQSTIGSGSASTTSKPLYSQKPFGSTTYPQSQFGSVNFQIGSKPQTTQGSSFTNSQALSQPSQFEKKPVSTIQTGITSQQTQFGSSGFQFGQNSKGSAGAQLTTPKPSFTVKPVYQQPQFAINSSKFGQNVQPTQSSGSVTTVTKPSYGQTSFGSSSLQTQFGSQIGQKPQTSQGSSFTSNTYSQSQYQFGKKPSGTGSALPQTQSGSADAGLTSQSGNNNSGSPSVSGFNFQQNQFASSSGSKFGQTTQTSQVQPVKTTQYTIKPFSSSQNTQGSTQISSTPSRFGESAQTNVPILTTVSQTAQPTRFGQKPLQPQFGSTFGNFGQKPQAYGSAFATSSGSNVAPFGITQVSKYQQTSQFGSQNQAVTSTQKPLGSSLSQSNYQQYQYSQNSDKSGSQSQFGQTSNSNVGGGQFGGHTTFGAQSQKPFGSQSTQTSYQQTQFTQSQKPFGSSQGTFQIGQQVVDQPAQSTGQTVSVAGYNYQKPQTVFTTQEKGPQDQKVQQTQSSFNSVVSTTQVPIINQSYKPSEIPSTQGTFQQSQSTVGSSQFGTQPTKATGFSGPVIQTSYNQFKPASTSSTLGSTAQSQASAVSTSQFGVPTKPATTHFNGQLFQSALTHGSNVGGQTLVGLTPQYSVQPSHGVVLSSSNPSHFSVEPYNPSVVSSSQASSFPSRVGSNEGLVISNVQSPIVPVPGYEIVTTAQGSSQGIVGLGEQFGGPRDPPRFDDKTGYHY